MQLEEGSTIARKQAQVDRTLTNEAIPFRTLRVISHNGDQLGEISLTEALEQASRLNLDLVLVSDNPKNPVAKIMDYGKYRFEQKKHRKEAKKNQKIQEVKEVQLKLTTDEHDLNFKRKNVCRFLTDGNKVKVDIRFRGREMTYVNQGIEVMQKFASECLEYGEIDREPKMEGRNMVMYLVPKKKKA